MDRDSFYICANGGKKWSIEDNITRGNYNMFLAECPLYDANTHTFDSSHQLFKGVFKSGYPWEVLEVFSGNFI